MAPAGWYPDAYDGALLRWWDGYRWTESTRPAYAAPVTAHEVPTRAGVPAWQTWWAIIPGLLLCLPVGLVPLWLRPGLTSRLRWSLTGAGAVLLVLALALPGTSQQAGTPTAADHRTETAATDGAANPATAEEDAADEASSPAPAVVVPDLTGLSREDARDALDDLGLALGEVTTALSRRAPGSVLRQRTAEGTEVRPGDRVDVVLAKALPAVPGVRGLGEQRAVRRLEAAGFTVDVDIRVTRSGRDAVVLEQTPGSGARRRPGATVRIVVSDVQVVRLVETSCTPGYSPCLAPASDYDCAGGSGDGPAYVNGTVKVTGADPYDLDRDGDGSGCD